MKKLLLTALIISMAITSLWSGGQQEASDKPVEIEVTASGAGNVNAPIKLRALIGAWNTMAWDDEARKAFYEKRLRAWAEANPDVYVEIDVIPGGQTAQAMTKLITAAAAGNPHDLANIDSSWVGNFHEAGILASIDEILPQSEKDQYFDFTKLGTMRNGKQYGLWAETGTLLYYYSTKYTDEAPRTWDDIFALNDKMKAAGETASPFLTQGKGNAAPFCFLPFFWAQGGILMDPADNYRPVFGEGSNRQIMIDSFKFIKDLIDKGVTAPEIVSYQHNELSAEAQAGRTASFIAGSWINKTLDQNEWKYTSLPMPSADQYSNIYGGWTFGFLTEDEKKLKAAVDFVQAVYTSEEAMTERLPLHGYIPTRKDVFDADVFSGPFYEQIYKELEVGRARPASSLYPVIDSLITETIGKIVTGEDNIEGLVDLMYKEVSRQYEESM